MENYKGKTIPSLTNFEINGSWIPNTPMKPHLGPIYENGDVDNYLSRFSQPNNHAQTLLSYTISSAEANNGSSGFPSSSSNNNHQHQYQYQHQQQHQNLWDDGSGRILNLQRENVGEMQRRGLEEYLPNWNSQGRRTKVTYPSTNPAAAAAAVAQSSSSSGYPYFSSWESTMQWRHNGVGDSGTAAAELEQLESYTSLLARSDGSGLGMGMGNAALYSGWDYNAPGGNNSNLYANPMYNPIFAGDMQTCKFYSLFQKL